MDNFTQNSGTARKRYNSVDGFVGSAQKRSSTQRQPIKPLSQIPAQNYKMPAMAKPSTKQVTNDAPKPPIQSANVPQASSSMIGTTINNYRPRNSPTGERGAKNKPPKSGQKKLFKRIILIFAIFVIAFIGYVGFRGISTLDKVFHGNVFSDISAAFSSTPLKGEDSGRVNILLAGDSADDLNHDGANLTDSILVLSIDTKKHSAFLMSIPRDLWVNIPGVGWSKINAANDGNGTNFPGYPQNGMGQLQHIVTTDLGIPIDYYALSDYGAFKDAVNAVGGVNVTIQSPDKRGLYDPYTNLKIPNGVNYLNGQTALNLARSRGDGPGSYGLPDSDFDRTMHQRQIFTAIAQKAVGLGFLSNPAKISNLFNAVGNNVQTDLSLQNVLRLVQITKPINLNDVKSYSYCSTLTVGQNGCSKALIMGYTDPKSGQEGLIPAAGLGDYSQMQLYYQQLTSNNPVIKEGANVVLLNGSTVSGVAKNQQTLLEQKGVNVTKIADTSTTYSTTAIIDNSKGTKPATLKLLQQLYPGITIAYGATTGQPGEAYGYNTSDFVVILGQNWANSNSTNNVSGSVTNQTN